MTDATKPEAPDDAWREQAFDLTRGIAAYTGSPLIRGLARLIAEFPGANIANAFNHKQVACKVWARDELLANCGGRFGRVWVLGGWYGVLPAMLFEDARFAIDSIDSIDIDPDVAEVALSLNHHWRDRFQARIVDMYALDYTGEAPDLVINTSCEHIPDLGAFLSLLQPGTRVLLQSNDYFSEPTHINCVPSLEAFAEQASLGEVEFAGALPMKNYTRFMLIGRV